MVHALFNARSFTPVKLIMLLSLLVLHFLAREQTGKTMPRSGAEFYRYSDGYPSSLAPKPNH